MTRARVLYVDDNATVRAAARGALEAAGYDAVVATDGHAALLYLVANTPDAIVVDEHMPRLDGTALISSIRAVERLRDVALVLTSERRSTIAQKARELVVGHVLPKPFSPAAIAAVLAKALEERARRKGDRHVTEALPSLTGRLDHLPLGRVLAWLSETAETGLLEVASPGEPTIRLWLRRGAIDLAAVESGHGADADAPRRDLGLARFLRETGTPDAVLESAGSSSDRALATALLRRGAVSTADVKTALVAQSREIVREALERSSGSFRFSQSAQSDEAETAGLAIDPKSLMGERSHA